MTVRDGTGLAGSLCALLDGVGLPADVGHRVRFMGSGAVFDSPFRLADAAAISIAACASAAAALWELRGGEQQEIEVDVGRAAAALSSWAALRLDGEPLPAPHVGNPFYDNFPCRDGRWLQLQAGLPNLVERTLAVLRCGPAREDVSATLLTRDAQDWEDALVAGGACGAVVRTPQEWRQMSHGVALAGEPVVAVRELARGEPEPLNGAERPLDGIRVLDLTRVIAGPVHGRTLAEHGADVMLINSPHLANVFSALLDTGVGKRSVYLDLRTSRQHAQLRGLIGQADVFVQGYRPGALSALGFGPTDVVNLRPGIVYTSVSCYGASGPWSGRRGWEQIAQATTGLALPDAGDEIPQLLPAAACDYVTGFLAALATMAALYRRALTGGSYGVEASLCRTAMWIQSLGPSDCGPNPVMDAAWTTVFDTAYGAITSMSPVAQLSRTPGRWQRPVEPPGSSRPQWDAPENPDARSGR